RLEVGQQPRPEKCFAVDEFVSSRQRLLLIRRVRLLYLLGRFKQNLLTLLELVDFSLSSGGFSPRAGRELHHDYQADKRRKEYDYRENPRNNSITKRFRGQIKTVTHWKNILTESPMAGQNWEKAYTALGTNRKRRFIYTHRSGGCCRNLEAAGALAARGAHNPTSKYGTCSAW